MTKKWLDRAIRIASVIIHDVARNNILPWVMNISIHSDPIRDYNKKIQHVSVHLAVLQILDR